MKAVPPVTEAPDEITSQVDQEPLPEKSESAESGLDKANEIKEVPLIKETPSEKKEETKQIQQQDPPVIP